MPQNGDDRTDRRTVLKTLTAGAVGAAAFSGLTTASEAPTSSGSEGAIDPDRVVESLDDVETTGDCYVDYKCSGSCPKDGSYEEAYERTCCRRGGGYICESWSGTGDCCF